MSINHIIQEINILKKNTIKIILLTSFILGQTILEISILDFLKKIIKFLNQNIDFIIENKKKYKKILYNNFKNHNKFLK